MLARVAAYLLVELRKQGCFGECRGRGSDRCSLTKYLVNQRRSEEYIAESKMSLRLGYSSYVDSMPGAAAQEGRACRSGVLKDGEQE